MRIFFILTELRNSKERCIFSNNFNRFNAVLKNLNKSHFLVKVYFDIEITLIEFTYFAVGFSFKLAKCQCPHNYPKTKHL